MAERELKVKISAEVQDLNKNLDSSKNKVKDFDKTVKKSGASIKKSASDMSKSSASSLGSLEQGIGKISPAAGQAVAGMKSMTVGAKALRMALGPIGLMLTALGVVVASLTSYFRGSAEGQERMAKIMATLGAVADTIKDQFISLGKFIYTAFTSPREALDMFMSRFEGMIGMVTNGFAVVERGAKGVALAIVGIFDRDAREASRLAFQEMHDGMEAFRASAKMAWEGVTNLYEQITTNAKEANKLQERGNKLRRDEMEARVRIAELDGKIAEARRIANDDQEDLNKQIAAQEKAMELVAEKFAIQEKLAKESLALQRERMELSENSIEDYEKEAELQERLVRLQQSRENETRSLLRRMGTLRNMQEAEAEEVRKALEAEQKLRDEMLAKQQAARDDILERIRKESMTELEILQEKMDTELEMFKGNEEEKAKVHAYWSNKRAELEAQLAEERKQRDEELAEANKTLFGEMGEVMVSTSADIGKAFSESAEAGRQATGQMVDQFKSQIVAALIARIMSAVLPGSPFTNIALAAGAGATASALFAQIPAFADGGKVTSPTLAMFGEYPGARTNPEYALRQDQLVGLMGKHRGELVTKISGQDLYIMYQEAERRNKGSF